jgi:hypothetical protein
MTAPSKTARREQAPLPRLRTRCVPLDPTAWGFTSRSEMEAVFERAEAAGDDDCAVAPGL